MVSQIAANGSAVSALTCGGAEALRERPHAAACGFVGAFLARYADQNSQQRRSHSPLEEALDRFV